MITHTFVVLAYKESNYLETCIKSVLNQKHQSNVVIATSTPNEYIYSLAKKYSLDVIENASTKKGIGYDFDFARTCVKSDLVTIAHQDDIYESDYSLEVIKQYEKYPDSLIFFSDYYELRKGKKVFSNTNLKLKKILLMPVANRNMAKIRLFKRLILAFGNSICCPAVTFVNANISLQNVFASDMKCNVDWLAWERISNQKGWFIYVNKPLIGHRIHQESTTSDIIRNNNRSKEDYEMFSKFWIGPIAKILSKVYSLSEKSNSLDD